MMTEMIIKKATPAYAAGMSEIEKVCFSVPWSEKSLLDALARKDAAYFVALSGEQVVGYIGSHNVLGEVGITNIGVLPAFRRQGIGEKLLNTLLEESEKAQCEFVTLEVRKSNLSAIALYEKTGFSFVGCRKNFYENPKEDGLIYTKYYGETL